MRIDLGNFEAEKNGKDRIQGTEKETNKGYQKWKISLNSTCKA